MQSVKSRYQALELSEKDMKDEYYHKCQEVSRCSKEAEDVRVPFCSCRKSCPRSGNSSVRSVRPELRLIGNLGSSGKKCRAGAKEIVLSRGRGGWNWRP